ncbi:MAG: PilZ domain-containing protein [Candidatus Acidiferrales bacterium]
MDRRLHTRFDLTAPVTYTWTEQDGISRTERGSTRDVSESGLFVLTRSFPPLGAAIQFEVAFSFRDESQIRMKTEGKVIRVDAGGVGKEVHGFAADTQVLWLQKQAPVAVEEMKAEYDSRN